MLDLSKLVVDTKSAWIKYPSLEGFEVEVAALSRKELTDLRKRCITQEYNRKTRTMQETLDEDKFVKEFTDATIKNWKGLTLEYLQSLVLMDTTGQDLSEEWPYDKNNAHQLIKFSTEFDQWLNEVVFDLDNFRGGAEKSSIGETG